MSLREEDDGVVRDLGLDVEQARPKKVQLSSSSFKKLALGVALVSTLCIGAVLYPKPQDTLATRFHDFQSTLMLALEDASKDIDKGTCELIYKEAGTETPDAMGAEVTLHSGSAVDVGLNIQIQIAAKDDDKVTKLVDTLWKVVNATASLLPPVAAITVKRGGSGAVVNIDYEHMTPTDKERLADLIKVEDVFKVAKPLFVFKFFVGRSFKDHIYEWSKEENKKNPWPMLFASFHASGEIRFTNLFLYLLSHTSLRTSLPFIGAIPFDLLGLSLGAIHKVTSTNTVEYESKASLEAMVNSIANILKRDDLLATLSNLESTGKTDVKRIPVDFINILNDLDESMASIESVDVRSFALDGLKIHFDLTNVNPMPLWALASSAFDESDDFDGSLQRKDDIVPA